MRRFLAASTACGVVIAGATIGSAVTLAGIVARVVTDPASRHLGGLAIPLAILLSLWIVRTAAQWLQGRLAQRGASAVIADLTDQVLRTATSLPPRQLTRHRDDAAVVVTRGLDGLRVYFTTYLPALFLAAILTPVTAAVIALYDWRSAVIVAVALPLIPLFMVLIGLATEDRSAAALAAMTTLQSRLLDLVAGLPTLRALGRAQGSAARIAELGAAHRRSAMATMRIAFLSALVLELLATLGVALVAVSVGMRLVYGQMPLQIALTALLLAPEVFWPLRRVGAAFHSAQDGKTAVAAAFEFIDAEAPAPRGTRVVAGDRVTVQADLPALDARPGRVTVLTGPNGAGKTTLLAGILGLEPLEAAHIRINGVDVADLDPQTWWARVAWLAQRPVLVPGTVEDNLTLFGPLPDLDGACRAACFDDVLAGLPDGLQTVLGRGGVGLSLGQRQRLGLARVLGSAAPVLLLDEPTAHLDSSTEARVLRAIRHRAAGGATVIVVGHRDPVLAIGDVVVDLGVDIGGERVDA
ncbi:cysteine export CydDC family ABC transporter permease subunit/ATP-binding protein CydD [Mycolicibacterium chubuense NBB4]|uniref:Cysteine export CydDC family ABC transporter permease subunit/ATP-binding protein CydD n=1 Tax=Mycolicibacterium chubuense (strain NBB4) TaxID=710421 RepID=I4BJ67_MYCCN|nr:thiol reductant ABC exporter subunit CydD [Mycolicibacterium chubuense]AFM17324.1 cysteine export CydDC family ABC transporter permease subunit/ATP-binding protein CydD [Mycolicibacterium chubuense NBB4]